MKLNKKIIGILAMALVIVCIGVVAVTGGSDNPYSGEATMGKSNLEANGFKSVEEYELEMVSYLEATYEDLKLVTDLEARQIRFEYLYDIFAGFDANKIQDEELKVFLNDILTGNFKNV